MFSVVAVGTDGSDTAAEAVSAAAEIARRFGAKVVLVSAYDPSRNQRSPTDPIGEWSYTPEPELREIHQRFERELRSTGLEVDSRVEEGDDPAEVLVRAADECGADLLVVGSKGMRRRFLGSVPNTVTHRARCSVVVVKTA